MNFIRKIPKAPKRSSRWRSTAHCNHVRSHACVVCGCGEPGMIEVAHVRMGSGAGMAQKPDDWMTVALCRDCHRRQHERGEETFWKGFPLEDTIREFIRTSPRRVQIAAERLVRNG